MKRTLLFLGVVALSTAAVKAQDPQLSSWTTNIEGEGGATYTSTELGPGGPMPGPEDKVVSINGKDYLVTLEEHDDSSNVTKISYSEDFVYVWSTGVASYNVGPYIYDGNTNTHEKVDHVWQIPRNPTENLGTKTTASLGNLAVFVNGTPYYPPSDGMYYYDDMGTQLWKRNAGVMEASGFDCSGGHPAGEYYHYHRIPSPDVVHGIDTMCLSFPSEGLFHLDDTKHSPIIGWGFDGFPIYGPYGFTDPNSASSGISLMEPSWEKRNYTNGKRISIWNETTEMDELVPPSQHGPDVDATVSGTTYPLGAFFEDYKYVVGSGDLDRYNGRFCVTPEYPGGIYAYFATVESDWTPAFPYIMGEELYGVAAEDNLSIGAGGDLGSSVSVNESTTPYFPVVTGTITGSEAANLLNAYPNPATSFMTINLNELMGQDVAVRVLDMMGNEIQSENISNLNYMLHVVDLNAMETGNYVLQVQGQRLSLSQQITVQ